MIYSRGRGRIVVGFTTICVTIVYHHKSFEFMFLLSAIYELWKKRNKKKQKQKQNKQTNKNTSVVQWLACSPRER